MPNTLYLIPDTNVFMQCRQLNELPWKSEFAKYDKLIISLTSPVIREIDRQKGGQGRLAKRARTASTLIGKLIDHDLVPISSEESYPLVSLTAFHNVRPNPELQDDLDYTQTDDSIVGIVATLQKENPSKSFVLLSNDNGLLMSARRTNTNFHRVPSTWLLPAESDEDQKRIRSLEEQIKRLQNHEPICNVQPIGMPWNFTIKQFHPLSEEQIEQLVTLIKLRFPVETKFNSQEKKSSLILSAQYAAALSFMQQKEFIPASDEAILEYQETLYPEWLTSCEDQLRELHTQLEQKQILPKIHIDIANSGSRPAETVKVIFSLSGQRLLLTAKDEDETIPNIEMDNNDYLTQAHTLPRSPRPPQGHWQTRNTYDSLFLKMPSFDFNNHTYTDIPPITSMHKEIDAFYWGEKTGKAVDLTCEQWRHCTTPESFIFELGFLYAPEEYSGILTVEIHASNLKIPTIETIPIRVFVKQENTYLIAEQLIELLE